MSTVGSRHRIRQAWRKVSIEMSLFEQLQSVGLKQQIQTRLKRAILDGSLAPGEQLVEGEIARQFGVSRSPVREAIQELERQGYVVKKPRRGTFVTELTPQTVTEIYSLRVLLEGYAATIAGSNCQTETIERMRDLVVRMEESMNEADFVSFSEADLEFHNILCNSTGHSHLIYLSQCLSTEMGFHVVLSRYSPTEVDNLIQEHWALVEAIEAGEPEEARRIVQQHIRMAGHLFLQKFFDKDALSVSGQEEERMEEFWKAAE